MWGSGSSEGQGFRLPASGLRLSRLQSSGFSDCHGFRVQDSEQTMSPAENRCAESSDCPGRRVQGLGFQASGLRVQGIGFRFSGVGFRSRTEALTAATLAGVVFGVSGFGFRIWGLGVTVDASSHSQVSNTLGSGCYKGL
jgi:hypothetical protein